jgi:nicotinamide phosphoribosyltransferase
MLSLIKEPNPIMAADSYKYGHWEELAEGTEYTWSAVVPRKESARIGSEIVAIGQTFIAEVISKIRITQDHVEEAAIEVAQQGYNFNREGWEIIVREFGGRLPLAMYAVEEGRIVKAQTPTVAFINTDPRFAWLPAYVESWTQDTVWLMSSVATLLRKAKKLYKKYMLETGADMSMLDFMVHNFGDRAAGSPEEGAVLTGIAHAVMFSGSDCGRANRYIKAMFGTQKSYTSSVEAFEHSTICSNSNAAEKDDFPAAVKAVERLEAAVTRSKAGIGIPLVSVVLDTYDDQRFAGEYLGTRLKDRIVNSGGRLVGRPDSGDPTKQPGIIGNIFAEKFGCSLNDSGYTKLAPCIGVIQGDGINIDTLEDVIRGWIAGGSKIFGSKGFSLDNFVTGMGNGTTNDVARDDLSWSMKAIATKVADQPWARLLKDPVTDRSKKSLSGLVRCREDENGELEVYDAMEDNFWSFDKAGPGWRLWVKDGYRDWRQSFDDVRVRANVGI